MLSFAPLENILAAKGIRKSAIKTEKIIGGGTYTFIVGAMKKPVREGLSISAINSLCEYLHCQPGDIMEWVPDAAAEEQME